MKLFKSIDNFFYKNFRIRFSDCEIFNQTNLKFDIYVQSLG
jgi:hypothetical protein